jgi:hypothetical protein
LAVSSATLSARFSNIVIESAENPERKSEAIMASPIVPAPTIAGLENDI